MRPTKKILLAGISLVMFVSCAATAIAANEPITITPEVPIPGTYDKTQTIDNNSIATYIRAIYIYFIWGVGILATVMITYGGFRWVAAAGNAARINDARETVNNAIIGLIIALTSYALLYVINPQLLNLKLPDIGQVPTNFFDGAAVTKICPPSVKQNCGEILKIGTGTRIDRNNKKVDEYCMGTVCEKHTSVTLVPQFSLCGVIQDLGTGYFQPGSGCIHNVPIHSTGPDYQHIASLEADSFVITHPDLFCGRAYSDIKKLGVDCPAVPDDAYFSTRRVCYMIGSSANIIDTSLTDDGVNNIRCAVE